jgi:hypothetical protein
MRITRRVFVSMPADQWLTAEQNDLKWSIVERVEALGHRTEVFHDPRGADSLTAGLAWTAEHADDIMRRCVGAVIIGLPRWTISGTNGQVKLATEYCHYEGAIARAMQLPTLLALPEDVAHRVVFDPGFGRLCEIPADADSSWLGSRAFSASFDIWERQIKRRRDVFLGYCSASTATARKIKQRLDRSGISTLDWKTDFPPGTNILQQIRDAATRCGAGVFLFTKDDELAIAGPESQAVPRDNVVFEAGYFIAAKGKDRVLIVREAGTKMPADLGGDIYATLTERTRLASINDALTRFIEGL